MALGRGSCRHRLALVVGIALAVAAWSATGALAAPAYTAYSTSTVPTIDGTLSPGEWSDAIAYPTVFAGGVTGTVRFKHDASYLYEAATISSAQPVTPSFSTFLDNDHNGQVALGDDAWIAYNGTAASQASINSDYFYSPDGQGGASHYPDTSTTPSAPVAGTSDIVGAGTTSANGATFEIRHPLCSGDTAHDMCVESGATVGVDFQYESANAFSSYPAASAIDATGFASLTFSGASLGSLDGSVAASGDPPDPQTIDLTAAGTADWAVWGYANGGSSTSLAPDVRRVNGVGISDLTNIDADPATPLRGLGDLAQPFRFNWTNGSNGTPVAGVGTGIQHDGQPTAGALGDGFAFDVPADTTSRTLLVYVVTNRADGRLTASLSDHSASDYVNVLTHANDLRAGVYTITYSAGSPLQTLHVQWIEDASTCQGFGCDNATLYAVALRSNVPDTTPPSVTLTAPQAGSILSGTVPVEATATDDVAVDHVTFTYFDGEVEHPIGVDSTAPYQASFDSTAYPNTVPLGATIYAEAVDTSGNTKKVGNGIGLANAGATVTLTASPASLAGVKSAPLSGIPVDAIRGATTGPSSSPLGGIPLGGIPLGGIPLGGIPLGGIPLGGIPLGGIALGLTASNLSQNGLGGVPLSSIPLKTGRWETRLAGTAFAGAPLSSVTLANVLTSAPAALSTPTPVTLSSLDLSASPLGGIPLGGIALGGIPLGGIPLGGISTSTTAQNLSDWCAYIAQQPGFSCTNPTTLSAETVIGLALRGVPLGGIPLGGIPLGGIDLSKSPLGGIPLGGIDLAGTPLGGIPLGGIDFGASPLGGIPLSTIPAANKQLLFSCGLVCSVLTLADAKLAGLILPGARLQDLGVYTLNGQPILLQDAVKGLPPSTTLADLLATVLSTVAYDWEALPLPAFPLQDFSPDGGVITYTVTVTLPTRFPAETPLTVSVRLPPGARYVGGSTTPTTSPPLPAPRLLSRTNTLVWDATGAGSFTFKAKPGLTLQPATATATATGASLPAPASSDPATTRIDETFTGNTDPATAPVIQAGTLYLGYTTVGNDRDLFRIQAPAPGVQRIFHLSHLHSDDDLVVYGAAPAPLRTPVPGATPLQVPDVAATLHSATQAITPEVLTDVPQGAPPGQSVLGVSDNRGLADETVTLNTPEDVSGYQTIQISSFDGSHSADPWMLRVEDLPALPLPNNCTTPATTSLGTVNALPTVPAGASTLYLINSKRFGDLYNSSVPGAEANVMAKLQTLASRTDAAGGAVIPVESDPAVATAYAAWTNGTNYCSPGKANDVVRAIGKLLDRIVTPSVKYIVVVGDGSVVPFGHVLDNTSYANERGYASTFAGSANNQYLTSFGIGFLLTDDALGDVDYPGSGPYVPELGVGRLVETPGQITSQIDQYVTRNGAITPTRALVTGYDFLSDGSARISAAQKARLGAANVTDLINETWTKDNVLAALGLGTATPQIASLNAHYDHNRALPADQNAANVQTNLLTTSNIAPGSVAGRLIMTMGCHSGLPVPDAEVSAILGSDWAETYAAGGAVAYLGNTGFGLGDTAGVAYSEKLNALFSERLNGSLTIGQALAFAKQDYAADTDGSGYHLKVIDEANMFGLPMYRLSTSSPAATPPPAPAPTTTDAATGLPATSFSVAPSFTLVTTPIGQYYTVGGDASFDDRRPIEPIAKLDITEPDLVAHGALVTGATSDEQTGVDAAFSRAVDDLSASSPELGGDVAYPTKLQTISSLATPQGDRQRLVLFAGAFRSDGTAPTVGTQRRFTSLSGTVLYAAPTVTDFRAPTFGPVSVTTAGGAVGFAVDASDLDAAGAPGAVKRVVVLYRDASAVWKTIDLSAVGSRWSGAGPLTGDTVEWYLQAADGAGNVGVTSNKATVKSLVTPPPTGSITASLAGPQAAGWFTGGVAATISGAPGIATSLDGAPFVDGTSVQVTGTGVHTLSFTGTDGSQGSVAIPIDVTPPTITVAGGILPVGTAPQVVCADAGSGIASCVTTPSPLDTTVGVHTVHVRAADRVGNVTTLDRTYTVDSFTGFFAPINNAPTINTVKAGSAVPVKFSLKQNLGLGIFQPGYPKSQTIACDSTAPQDAVEQTVTAGGSSLSYDAGSDQYTYVWKTDKSWSAGSCRQLIVRLVDGTERRALFQLK